ncbi:hypothetical protein GGR06_000983 [Bacteroides reticulotermitis]|uniref:Uncharacterized protein n=1 Tax=Bacteroides reticulotermitis TaxID=1133319 RepID=A0A840CV87_9BACE|nr:hypothetical protein [Bacteroides reticulotermitis]
MKIHPFFVFKRMEIYRMRIVLPSVLYVLKISAHYFLINLGFSPLQI